MPFGKSLALSIVIGGAVSETLGKAFRSTEQRIVKIGETAKRHRLGATLAADVIKYRSTLEGLKAKQATLGRSSSRLNAGIAEVERRYRDAKQAARAYGVSIGDVVRQHRRLERSATRAEASLARVATRERNAQVRSELHAKAIGTLGAAYAASRIFGGAIEVQDAQVRLRTVINAKDTAAALKASRRHALDFARDSLASEVEVLNIEYALDSAGLDAATARLGTEIVHKVATVTQGSAAQVGEVVGVVFNNLGAAIAGTATDKLARIGDVLTKTQFKFQIRDFGQLGESFKEGAAAAIKYKVSLEQTAATLGSFNTAGLMGGRAGTAFNAVLRQLGRASQQFGFTIERNAAGEMDLVGTLGHLKEALDAAYGTDVDARAAALQKAFGDEGSAVALLLGNMAGLTEGYRAVADGSRGVVDTAYQDFLASTGGRLRTLGQNLKIVGNLLAGTLVPALNAVLTPIAAVARWVGIAVAKVPALGMVLGGATLGFAGFTAAAMVSKYVGTLFSDAWTMAGNTAAGVGRMITWTTERMSGFNAVALITAVRTRALAIGGGLKSFGGTLLGLARGAIPAVVAGLRMLGVAIAANPIGAAIAVIALGAGLIIANWSKVKGFLLRIWEPIKAVWAKFAGWVGGMWEKISAPFAAVAKWFGGGGGKTVTHRFQQTAAAATLGAVIATAPLPGQAALPPAAPVPPPPATPRVRPAAPVAVPPPVVRPATPVAQVPSDLAAGASPSAAPPRPPEPAPAGHTITYHQTNTFHITARPGQDVHALAEEVARLMARQHEGLGDG